MIQNDQTHADCSSTETRTIAEDYELSLGNQLHLLNSTCERLVGDARLAELHDALEALDTACAPSDDEMFWGTSDEDAAVQERVADELVAINRRLNMLVALATVRDAVRRLGRVEVKPEVVQDESEEAEGDDSDAVEH